MTLAYLICEEINVNDTQFRFMFDSGTINEIFISKQLQTCEL